MLMSATVSEEVERLQRLVLHNPVTLNMLALGSQKDNLRTGAGTAAEIEHFSLSCPKEDKLIYVMALLKLNLVRKKVWFGML